jgi:hypothetical protein
MGKMKKPTVKRLERAADPERGPRPRGPFAITGLDFFDTSVPGRERWCCAWKDLTPIEDGGTGASIINFAPGKKTFVKRNLIPFQAEAARLRRKPVENPVLQSDAEPIYFVKSESCAHLRDHRLQISAPYTKEQNGGVEKFIGTLKDEARTLRMEVEAKTGKRFPDKAISWSLRRANYMIMRRPATDQDITPYERLYGTKPNFVGLYYWFDTAFAHEPKEKRSRSNDRKGAKCHYLGPSPNMKDASCVIMVERGGKYGSVVHRHKIKTVRGGYHPGMKASPEPVAPGAPVSGPQGPAATSNDGPSDQRAPGEPEDPTKNTPKRKRGAAEAPPKQAPPPLVKKGRGRPPKRTTEAAEPPVKRGPGRPRKEPEKTKQAPRAGASPAPNKTPSHAKSRGNWRLRSETFSKTPRGLKKGAKKRAIVAHVLACIERRQSAESSGRPISWHQAYLAAEKCIAKVEKDRDRDAQFLPPTPKNLEEALKGEQAAEWQEAYDKEMKAIQEHGTYVAAPLWRGRTVKSKMIYRVTREKEEEGYRLKFKARLVAQGFSERHGIDYFETFAPTISTRSLHSLLHIAAKEDHEIRHIDVGAAYLESELDTELYMMLPDKKTVVRLIKSIYGLKQSAERWYSHLTNIVTSLGFRRCYSDPCVFIKGEGDRRVYLGAYVDDILLIGKMQDCTDFEKELAGKVTKIKAGEALRYTGVEIKRDRAARTVTLSQGPFIKDMIEAEGLTGAKGKSSPASSLLNYATLEKGTEEPLWSVAGKVRYAVDHSRPDALYIASQLSSVASSPGPDHPKIVKRLMRYLLGSVDEGLTLGGHGDIVLECYVDASLVEDGDSRSQLGHCWRLNSESGFCSSKSTRDHFVSLSSAESELRALKNAMTDVLWAREFLFELGYEQKKPTKVYEDNQAVIDLMGTLRVNARTKHLTKVLNFTRDYIRRGEVCMVKVASADNVADVFTKALPAAEFIGHKRTLLGQRLLEQ